MNSEILNVVVMGYKSSSMGLFDDSRQLKSGSKCTCHWLFFIADKLAARSQKVAYYMLNKLGGGKLVQPGDRVALVFRPDEAAQFVVAFYGCIFAAVIPVAIEPPITKDVRKRGGGAGELEDWV